MGLKEITRDEAAQIKTRPGIQPGTTLLTFAPVNAGRQSYSREMVVSESTRRVNEFRVISGDGKGMIALATIKSYRRFPLGARTSAENSTTARETCSIPEKIVLEWKRELLSLDVVLKDVKVNQFDTSKRADRFVQPTIRGYAAVNLAEVARQKDPASSTAVRETIPVPETRNRVRLNPPLQIRGDDAAANAPRGHDQTRPKSPILAVPDLEVVDAPVPTAPGTPADRGGTAFLTGPGSSLEHERYARSASVPQSGSHGSPVFGGIAQPFPGLGENRPDGGLGNSQPLTDFSVVHELEVIEPNNLGLPLG